MIPCCSAKRVLKFPLFMLAFFAVLALNNSASAVAVAGNPDIGTPGGFGIEGNLWANSPNIAPYNNASDWLPLAGGIGIGVLDASGNPVDATNTFHRVDLTGNNDLDVFAESDKVFHNPNTYNWKAGSVPQKDDIQNGLIHISIHPITGDLWVTMAGDRRAENGDSYIDFEFLQNTLTKNPDGTFTSLGPDKGRTVGDILLTIELTKGGGQASFFVQRWQADPTDTFTYVDFTPAVGAAFVGANIDSAVTAPYSPFTYAVNSFGEAAANLSELIASIDTCFGAKTIWIRTKSSQSPSAQLKDLVEPIQLNLCLDHTPPVITCPGNKVFDCAMGDPGQATATDNCDGTPTISFSDDTTSQSCPLVISRTWIAVDDCGNADTCFQTITVQDTTDPVVSCPANKVFDCNAIGDFGVATATDNCDLSVVPTHSDVVTPGDCPQESTITRTWIAVDDCGNADTCVQTIAIQDTTNPVISCPANKVFDCNAIGDFGAATAVDNCDPSVVPTHSDDTTSQSCPLVISRTWIAVDDCGNADTCVQTITIQDTTNPVISCPANKVFDCNAIGDFGVATATDNCDLSVVPTYSDVVTPGDCPQESTITRTWIAVDDCGNADTCVQTITIQDTTNPVISCPSNKVFDCDAVGDFGKATAVDNCDPEVIPTFTDVVTPGDCPQESTITRTWIAVDDCGNADTCVQTITIQDTTNPVITCPANKVFDCNAIGDFGVATAVDNCDPSVVPTYSDVVTPGDCPQESTITRTWIAVDDCGNADTCVQTIVIQDTTDPVITCPANVVYNCDNVGDPGRATATDNCDPSVAISSSDDTTSQVCPLVISRTWIAVDDCGNADTCVQTITVQDTTDPVVSCPANKVFDCNAIGDFGVATATDNCDLSVVPTYSDVVTPGDCPQESTITRTWIAVDDCGNADTCVQTITIQDTTNPVISCPSDKVFDCDAVGDFGKATAVDNCDPEVIPTFTDVVTPGDCPQESTITRTWIAVDDCGNADTCVQTIVIQDTTNPVITCPANKVFDCNAIGDFGVATAVDNCDPSVVPTHSDDTTSQSCPLVIARTWIAVDDCGNADTCVQTITIQDTTKPVVTCPADKVFDCTMGDAGKATATDNCDPEVIPTSSDNTISARCPIIIERTWTATDDCGNSSSCVQTITVQDTTKPTISCPANDTVSCGAAIIFGDPTANDNCDPDPQISIVSDQTTPGPGLGETTYTRTWEATDSCDNVSATCSQSIIKKACPTGNIFPTQTTCTDFLNGTTTDLTQVCYGVKSNYIKNTAPGVFFYYTKVTAPSSSFTINIVQTNNNGSFPLFGIQQEDGKPQIILWSGNCIKLSYGTFSGGQGSVNVTGATVGQTYVVSVKYSTSTVVGTYVPTRPTVHYDFSTNINGGASFSLDGLDLKNCVGGGITAGEESQTPSGIELDPNYPNPFNANTTIKYSLPNDGKVTIAVYNIIGQKVITLADGVQTAGYHTVTWDGKNASGNSVASGVYFYRIQFGDETQIKRMTLLK